MALSLGKIRNTAVTIFSAGRDGDNGSQEVNLSPLEARRPDVSLQEIYWTGKSAARIRVEKGIPNLTDKIEVFIEDKIAGRGQERV